ncbi:MAG: hypothetical protein P1U86_01800 [Verrucomicrobiales bacterium]|nr:hypothetical protein [Verrucomicrobiales bacterium]
MKNDSLQNSSRRKFLNKLAVGSLTGLVAGSVAHAADDKKKDLPIILQDPNVCRGLNTCKGKGKGEHDCAGQSMCATAEAHACGGANACKGQGGCGTAAGQNECKGKGDCAVPLKEKAWKKARAAFESAAKENGIKVGPAPARG